MTLGEKIRQLRNQAGLTQPELAVKAKVEQSYLSKLENDKASPSFDVIEKIAQALELEVMALIESLDNHYLQQNLAHLPEVALKLDHCKQRQNAKLKKGYLLSALLIVCGVALVTLGNSNTIFPNMVYQYKSMGFINSGEVNRHFRTHPLHELAESREQSQQRIAKNISRIDEELLLTRSYQGESYVENYGPRKRYFELVDQREVESPMRDISMVMGFICLLSGGFGLGYVFRFFKT